MTVVSSTSFPEAVRCRESPRLENLLFQTITSGSICIGVFGPLPWSFEGQEQLTFTGGTGKLSGATGSGSTTFHGAILQNDSQGHGMSWNAGSRTGQITIP